jgi:hypothetical protein
MALTTIETNNKLVQFRRDIIREYVQENEFSKYMGDSLGSIIRILSETKKGGEQINVPLVNALRGTAKSTGTLSGSEESIDNYGCRLYIDWARHAVATNDAEEQKDSAAIFDEAKPLLAEWGKDLQRNEIIEAFMALPSEAAPAGLGSAAGQRVNGILYQAATATQRNTWNADNSDRVLYGNVLGNYNATHATALATLDPAADTFKAASIDLLKYVAKRASPKITPHRVTEGGSRQFFVAFVGSNNFAQISADLKTLNIDARPRDVGANPVFQDGDLLYRGVIIREVPEIDGYVDDVWTSLKIAGDTASRVAPVFFCGQNALAMPYGKMPTPTTKEDTDYQFLKGAGVKMCYGVGKLFKKETAKLVQRGMVTGFFSAANPA